MLTGRVSTQVVRMVLMVDSCTPERLTTMVPATALDRIWVVDTGAPITLARPMDSADMVCAAMPCA
ncbi:hypothetical protein D3C78_1966770 [compost metagenome]